jgi:uncharacterized protein involved in exopolysaccharide biosynthesis
LISVGVCSSNKEKSANMTDQSSSNNLWLFLEVLVKRRNMILTTILLITLIALILSFIMPKWYSAQAQILPPKNVNVPASGFRSMAEAISVTTGLTLPVMATPSDIYARMLESRNIVSAVIERLELNNHYNKATYEEAYNSLIKHTNIEVSEEGILVVAVEDKSPQMASDIANSFVEELERLNHEIVSKRIDQLEDFVQQRLSLVQQQLDSARRTMDEIQLNYNSSNLDRQARQIIDRMVDLKIQLAEIDFEIQQSKSSLDADDPKILELKKKKAIVEQKIKDNKSTSSMTNIAVPLEVLMIKVSEALYEVLLEQREQIKIKEYEKMPTLTVLDWAEVPQKEIYPRKLIIVFVSFVFSILFSILLALWLEFLVKLEKTSPDNYLRVKSFINAYLGWLPGVKKK